MSAAATCSYVAQLKHVAELKQGELKHVIARRYTAELKHVEALTKLDAAIQLN